MMEHKEIIEELLRIMADKQEKSETTWTKRGAKKTIGKNPGTPNITGELTPVSTKIGREEEYLREWERLEKYMCNKKVMTRSREP